MPINVPACLDRGIEPHRSAIALSFVLNQTTSCGAVRALRLSCSSLTFVSFGYVFHRFSQGAEHDGGAGERIVKHLLDSLQCAVAAKHELQAKALDSPGT